jgi:hypothetical protein
MHRTEASQVSGVNREGLGAGDRTKRIWPGVLSRGRRKPEAQGRFNLATAKHKQEGACQ